MTELLVLLVVGAPAIAGLVAWFSGARWAPRVALTGLAPSIVAGIGLATLVFANGSLHAFDGLVVIDAFGAYVLVLVLGVAGIASAGSPALLLHGAAAGALGPHDGGRYYALRAGFTAGLAAVPLIDNLGLVWVGIE